MSRINSQRKSCIDVFNAFLVAFATFAGIFEFPCIKATYDIPNKLVSFSKCISCKDYNQWVHFYEDDYLFERIWRNPQKYLDILKRFNGVILAGFQSLQRYAVCNAAMEYLSQQSHWRLASAKRRKDNSQLEIWG